VSAAPGAQSPVCSPPRRFILWCSFAHPFAYCVTHLGLPCFCILCLGASMMLMMALFGFPSGAICTSGARCSTFALTSSRTALGYSHLLGLKAPAHSLNQLLCQRYGFRVGLGFELGKVRLGIADFVAVAKNRKGQGFACALTPTRCPRPCMMSWPIATLRDCFKASRMML
jgi:hypothetical protein